tara:strand:+ start:26605 stop:26778 length:174 start_codon:yes stop_codon:yes gene_type:complete
VVVRFLNFIGIVEDAIDAVSFRARLVSRRQSARSPREKNRRASSRRAHPSRSLARAP